MLESKPSHKAGIYSGSFDPIHLGHIEFALEAIKKENLDIVYFLPERQPRHKQVSHYAHRVAMIKLAIKPYPKLKIIDLEDRNFTVNRTMPKIRKVAKDAELFFLFGSDKVKDISSWPNYQAFLRSIKIIIIPREKDLPREIKKATQDWPTETVILPGNAHKDISSGKIRQSLEDDAKPEGLLASSQKYIRDNWLYISLDIR